MRGTGLAIALTLALVPSASAEIVYTHGTINPPNSGPWTAPGTLMAMNDDGSEPHVLLSPSQVPTDQAAVCCVTLQPGSATMAFDGLTYQNVAGNFGDGLYFEGAYALAGGTLTRLSPAPESSPGNDSSDNPLALTADGRVVYERVNCNNVGSMQFEPTCSTTLNVVPDTGGTSATWAYDGGGPLDLPPSSFGADPVNGGLLAYVSPVQGNSGLEDDLLTDNQTASSETVVATEPDGENPAWSPNGSELVDDTSPPPLNSGINTPAALWLYPAAANQTGTELISDPSSPTTAFSDAVFAGPNEIVFVADDNLWEIPASCNMCTYPGSAKQLTTDGTSTAPDSGPAWTSQTITPLGGNPNPNPNPNPGPNPGPATGSQITALKLVSGSVKSGKPVIVDVTLKAATTIKIEVLAYVPGKHHHKGKYKLIGTITFAGKSGLNAIKFTKVGGHKLKASKSKYELLVSAGGAPRTLKLKIKH